MVARSYLSRIAAPLTGQGPILTSRARPALEDKSPPLTLEDMPPPSARLSDVAVPLRAPRATPTLPDAAVPQAFAAQRSEPMMPPVEAAPAISPTVPAIAIPTRAMSAEPVAAAREDVPQPVQDRAPTRQGFARDIAPPQQAPNAPQPNAAVPGKPVQAAPRPALDLAPATPTEAQPLRRGDAMHEVTRQPAAAPVTEERSVLPPRRLPTEDHRLRPDTADLPLPSRVQPAPRIQIGTLEVRVVSRPETIRAPAPQPPPAPHPPGQINAAGAGTDTLAKPLGFRYGLIQS
jgi:hypothetical protein